ncbi:hypothetical protein SK128_012552, partial [Halocaridina rubra]
SIREKLRNNARKEKLKKGEISEQGNSSTSCKSVGEEITVFITGKPYGDDDESTNVDGLNNDDASDNLRIVLADPLDQDFSLSIDTVSSSS